MTAVNHWLSGASPDVRGVWASQRPSEPPTLTLDAFEQDAGFAALAWTRATSRCITDYQGNVHEIPASAKPRNGVRVVLNLFASSGTLSTQGVTVVVGATYVVSFYGTGSLAFSGAATGSLAGTGASTRVYTTVTATTTTLTCTVTGSVTSAQCQRASPGQTEPDEYVSVGVLATPYHDGIGVDGLRYFNTTPEGALITGTQGYDRDGTGAWVASPDVDPIVPSIPVGVGQTNRITYSSDLSSGAAWTKRGTCTATAGYDAQVGGYSRIAGLGVGGVNDIFFYNSGYSTSVRIEPACYLRAVSTAGSFEIVNPGPPSYTGKWTVDLSLLSTTRFEWVTRDHPAVTVVTEFQASSTGYGGWQLRTTEGPLSFDIARVALAQGERVHEIPLEATALSTINADVPYFGAISAYATNNAGTVVVDFTPKAQTSLQAYYLADLLLCYKNSATDLITQYDGTTSASFGSQTEGTRTKIATSWQTGVGRYGYRDGVSKFAATAYDGAWASANQSFTGPMEIHRYLMHRTAEATTYLQGATA